MLRLICLLLLLAGVQAAQKFSIPLEVTNLPAEAEFVPVHAGMDFTEVLQTFAVKGAVGERSLRLFRVVAENQREEIPYQFSANPQPRAKTRRLLTNTPPAVSYVSEFPADETPENIRVAGELAWIVRKPVNGTAVYVLEFGVPTNGVQVQTPFPPQSLRAFDGEGRGSPVRWFPRLQLHPQWPIDGLVHFYDGRDLITSYNIGPALTNSNPTIRRPHFYPVLGPDNIPLTEFGKPHDPTGSHAHHYSLWITHNSVNGIDFWGERGGIIAHEALDLMEDGPIFSRLIQRARWRHNNNDVLRETRTVTTFVASNDFRALDIEITLTPATNAVTFGKTSFGFLAARVAQSMTPFDGAGEIRTSTGALNEARVHLTHAAWLDQSGPIAQDQWGGIAILDHPDNPRFPTGWHCRNDGWAGAAFNLDGPLTLERNATLRLRYRVVLHRGDAIKGEIAKRFFRG
jgi:hypothetical protein